VAAFPILFGPIGCVAPLAPTAEVVRASEATTESTFANDGPAVIPPVALPAPVAASAPESSPVATPVVDSSLDLTKLETLAQSHNPILQRDQAQIESARGKALQAGIYPNPTFDAGNPQSFAGRNSQFGVGFSQEIVTKGKLTLDVAAAEQEVRQAELTYQQNRLDLLSNVRKQYFTVLVDKRRVEVLTEMVRIVRASEETGRKLQKAGESSVIDTLLLTVDAQKVESDLRQAEVNLAADRKQLAAIVGVASVEKADITGDPAAGRPDFDEELVRKYAATGSTLVRAAQAEVARRRLLFRRAEVEPYPNVTIGPVYTFGLTPRSELFGLQVTFPVPVWDRNQGNILSAAADIRNAEMSLRVLQNDQLSKVADTIGRYLAARQQVERFEQNILPNVKRVQELSQEGYAKGVFEFARYLQAQRTVVETSLSYLDALQSLWSAAADLAGLLQLEQMPKTTK
jgi:cobalt-zinc-cadmium efflux system outer membrane protein